MRSAAAAVLPPSTHHSGGDCGSRGDQLRISADGVADAPMAGPALPLAVVASQLRSETAHVQAGAALQASCSGSSEHKGSISRSSNSGCHSGRSGGCGGAGGSDSGEAIPPTQVQEHALWPGQSPQFSLQLQSDRRSGKSKQRSQKQSAAELSSAWLQQPPGKENGQHREGSQDCTGSVGCPGTPPGSGSRSSSAKRQKKSGSCDISPLKLQA